MLSVLQYFTFQIVSLFILFYLFVLFKSLPINHSFQVARFPWLAYLSLNWFPWILHDYRQLLLDVWDEPVCYSLNSVHVRHTQVQAVEQAQRSQNYRNYENKKIKNARLLTFSKKNLNISP